MTNEDDTTSATNRLLTGYLNAQEAAALDADLMASPGFSLAQLMELAGLSVAEAVYDVVEGQPLDAKKKKTPPHILFLCGPGNNGGDGLVAARHLTLFGYDCVVVYPKRSTKEHFINLVQQCEDVGIPILDRIPNNDDTTTHPTNNNELVITSYDAIVDAIFGFSFLGKPREPFAMVLEQIQEAQANHQIPVLSVDVPSGWHVELGDVAGTGFVPDVLISLTAPKVCARHYGGRHFVGGRFLPPSFAEKYHIQMPPYPGVSQVMEIPSPPSSSFSSSRSSITSTSEGPTSVSSSSSSEAGWEAEYAAYLKSQHAHQAEVDDAPSNSDEQHDTTADSSSFSWEAGYAAYCAEKEARLAADEDARRSETAGNKE